MPQRYGAFFGRHLSRLAKNTDSRKNGEKNNQGGRKKVAKQPGHKKMAGREISGHSANRNVRCLFTLV
jgi:hypothetical protein